MNNIEIINQNNYYELYEKEKKLRTSIYKFAHEIKNPLAVCNGYLDMINEKDDVSKEKYLKIIKEEIKRTLNVINDFSFFSKEKHLEIEKIDLSVLLEDIKKTINPLLENNNGKMTMILKDKLYLKGDYLRLKQVFMNIIKNAIESKDNKMKLIVSVSQKKDYYQIKIKDNGSGMSKKELKQIYNEYYTTKENGTGLGIPYAKEIIELHGGSIKYQSKKDYGTTVIINLPKEKSP